MTSAVLLATLVAAFLGGSHYVSHRVFGDEVYNSKAGVAKTTVIITGLAWFTIYIVMGDLGDSVVDATAALLEGMVRLFGSILGGIGGLL